VEAGLEVKKQLNMLYYCAMANYYHFGYGWNFPNMDRILDYLHPTLNFHYSGIKLIIPRMGSWDTSGCKYNLRSIRWDHVVRDGK
jgi:hypothetical protein